MKKIAFLLLMLLSACTSEFEVPKKPDDILEEEQLEQILLDAYLIEGRYQRRLRSSNPNLRNTRPEILAITQYKQLFEKHGINREDFEISYKWYASYPAALEKIESRVLEQLQQIQANIDAGVEDEKIN